MAKLKAQGTAVGTQVELHDTEQLEIRFDYAMGGGVGKHSYNMDAFLFVPRNVGLSRKNYTRDEFYADVTPYMRLDADVLPLAQLPHRDMVGTGSVPGLPLVLQMFLEGALQLRMGCCLDHLRQRLEDLVFRVVNVLQFVNEKVVQRVELCHGDLLAYAEGGRATIVESTNRSKRV